MTGDFHCDKFDKLKGQLQCNLIKLWGNSNTCAKKVGWEVISSEHGFAGFGAHKPRWEFKGSALIEAIFYVVLRLNGT